MKKRLEKQDWFAKGLSLLTEQGGEALTIDAMCTAMKRTKGSFYHHFQGREGFVRALMEYWIDVHTEQAIALTKVEGSPLQSWENIIDFGRSMSHEIDHAVRAWALREPLVREYQERVDAIRIDHLRSLFLALIGDKEKAEMMAHLSYSIHVGSYALVPKLTPRLRTQIAEFIRNAYGFPQSPKENAS